MNTYSYTWKLDILCLAVNQQRLIKNTNIPNAFECLFRKNLTMTQESSTITAMNQYQKLIVNSKAAIQIIITPENK